MKPLARLPAAILLSRSGSPVFAEGLDANRLSLEGLGPLRIGMTASEVRNAGYRIAEPEFGELNGCAQVRIIEQEGVRLMFETDRVSRIEVNTPNILSVSGAHVGQSEEEIKRIYGSRLIIEGHQYDPDGHYLKVLSHDKKSSMVFETDGKVAIEMRAGPATQYVEGCL